MYIQDIKYTFLLDEHFHYQCNMYTTQASLVKKCFFCQFQALMSYDSVGSFVLGIVDWEIFTVKRILPVA